MEPSITDWMSAWSSVAAAIVAVVTGRLAYKQFLRAPKQETESENAEDKTAAEQLIDSLVFKTSKQKTFLNATPDGLKCRIEDTRPDKGGFQWMLSKEQVTRILNSKDYSVNPGYKARSGTFSIGPRKNWLYSKGLFPEPEYLHGVLKELLEQTNKLSTHSPQTPYPV